MPISVVHITRYQNPNIGVTGTFPLVAAAAPGNLLVVAVIIPAAASDRWGNGSDGSDGVESDADGKLTWAGGSQLPVYSPYNDPFSYAYFPGAGVAVDLWYCTTLGATAITWASGDNPSFIVYEVAGPLAGWALDDIEGSGAASVGGGAPVVGSALANNSGGDEMFFQIVGPYQYNLTAVASPWTLDAGLFVDHLFDNAAGLAYFIGSGNQTAPAFTIDGVSGTTGYTILAASFKPVGGLASGNIVVSKVTNPLGPPQIFTFTPNWGAPFTLTNGQTKDSGPLAPGTYSVAETPVDGWTTTVSQDPSAIVVTAGQTVTITFTNAPIPPIPPLPCAPLTVLGKPVNGVFVDDLGLFIIPATALYDSLIPNPQLSLSETANQGRREIIVDFNGSEGLWKRDLGTIFTWPMTSRTALYVWQPSIIPFPMGDDIYFRLSFHALMSSLGITGWGHVREMNIAHQSTADLTLLLTFDTGPTISLTVPNSGGQYAKTKVTIPANKFKMVEVLVSSTAPFKLYGSDLEMKCGEWGRTGPYKVHKPVVD